MIVYSGAVSRKNDLTNTPGFIAFAQTIFDLRSQREELETGPLVTRADAQAAQREFVDAALRLAQEGKISLAGAEDML